MGFQDLVKEMVNHDLQVAQQEAMLQKATESMQAGATGLIFGRNVWQRDHDESLRFVAALQAILDKFPSGETR